MKIIALTKPTGKSGICLLVCFSLFSMMGGCTSGFTNIAPLPPQEPTSLGHVTGKACGSLVSPLIGTAYYVLPIYLNSRIERAYEDALNKAPGATGLTNVSMQENWGWWIFGTARCVTLEGEAIK